MPSTPASSSTSMHCSAMLALLSWLLIAAGMVALTVLWLTGKSLTPHQRAAMRRVGGAWPPLW